MMEDPTYFRALLEPNIQKSDRKLLRLQDMVQRTPALTNIPLNLVPIFMAQVELAGRYLKMNAEDSLEFTKLMYHAGLQLYRGVDGFERTMQVTHREITESPSVETPQRRRGFFSRLFGRKEEEEVK